MAPDPRDVVWTNAHVDKAWINGQEWTANVLLGLGAVLWSVPVTAIQALANLHSLARIPGLNWVANIANSDFAAFLNGYLPVLVLLGLIAALPPFFSWIGSTYERRKTRSDIEHSTLKRFFYYQLANIYVTVTAGSILDSLAAIIEDPSQVFVILGKSVPSVVGYFVMFVLTKLLAGLPLVFLQSGTLFHRIISIALCRDRISTQRELDEAYKPLPLDLGQEYPNQLLVIVIVFTYATISPIILPVGALYFLGALIVFKKQMLLAFSQAYESGGTFFPTACNRTLVGLIAAQLTLIGYTILRKGFYQPLVLLPLPFYTVGVMSSFKHLYENPGQYLSLERAVDLDKRSTAQPNFDTNVYRQPSLIPGEIEPMPHRRPSSGSAGELGAPDIRISSEKIV
jgi:hypothetical protein